MANLININAFANATSVENLKAAIEQHINRFMGHSVSSMEEADTWFDEVFGADRQDTHTGDTQRSELTIVEDGEEIQLRVIIEEIVSDSASEDYCYMVRIYEL